MANAHNPHSVKQHPFRRGRSIVVTLLTFISLFSGCEPAQSKNASYIFDRDTFDAAVKYATEFYLDSNDINYSRAYVGASEMALASLPYSLILMPVAFYEKRETVQLPERVVPGKVIKISSDDPYLILVPDYVALEKQAERALKAREAKIKRLSPADAERETQRLKDRLNEEKKALEMYWDQIPFSSRDFHSVIAWIEQNLDHYNTLPSTHKGENPYKDEPFSMKQVYFNAANGFMQTIDPHSGVIPRELWEKMKKESEDSSFEGIGAMLRGGDTQDVVVETPLANSPALRAGLHAGDIIKTVDGKSIIGLPLSEVVKRIRGKKNTKVTLGIERPPIMNSKNIEIIRSLIVQKAVTSEFLPGDGVAVLKVSSFLYERNSTSDMVREEYQSLLKKSNGKIKGIILDLRGNPGGILDEAIQVSGLFLKKGSIVVHTQSSGSGRLVPKASNSDPVAPVDIPMIVLINAGSASASEIVASALLDHNRALILGDRSFGKASVQTVDENSATGIVMKITVARYYAPRGYTIQVFGVVPDIAVSDEPDGTFPVRFREEDMWKHLPELTKRSPDPIHDAYARKVKDAVGKNSVAESYLKKHRHDAQKPDYMLIRSLSYLKYMANHPIPH